jgi:uncharacterized protein YaiE (UPF0345 family)
MAGSLVISTLNNDTGVLATQNGMTGIPKAFVTFGGGQTYTAGAIQGTSFNVSSITVSSTGVYIINFTTAMANANYSVCASGSCNSAGANMSGIQVFTTGSGATFSAPTTSSFYIFCGNSAFSPSNNNLNCVAVFSS